MFWTQDDGRWSACDDVSQVEQFIREREAGTSVRARAPANVWTDGVTYLERELGRKFPGQPVWGASRNTWIKHVVR